jgi:signal peptidase I
MTEKNPKAMKLERVKRIERIILLPILAAAAAAFFVLGRVEVIGRSMEPNFHDGQRLIVIKTYKQLSPLKVGDVIVVEAADKKGREAQIIKRIAFIQNAQGTLPWPGILPTSRGEQLTPTLFPSQAFADTIPKNGILVLGDNLENSTDSREFGPIYPYEVFAKVISR